MKNSFHIVVSGRVQGVSFRYFTLNQAIDLGIKGIVRNLETGQVEIFATGEKSIMEEFIDRVKSGPTFSFVENIDIKPIESKENFTGFEIVE